jgi:hypothetical protein
MRPRPGFPLALLVLLTGGCDASGGAAGGGGGEDEPFVITSKAPSGGAVSPTAKVEVGFSDIIDAASVDQGSLRLFTVVGDMEIFGAVTVDGYKLRFTPSVPLIAGTSYAVHLASDVRDLDGALIGETDPWGFKTGGLRPDDPPDATGPDAPRPR